MSLKASLRTLAAKAIKYAAPKIADAIAMEVRRKYGKPEGGPWIKPGGAKPGAATKTGNAK